MHLLTAYFVLPLLISSTAAYTLRQTYDASNFFSQFNFFTAADPTHGDVSYVPGDVAWSTGLVNTNNGQIYLGVDHTTVNPTSGRRSVRVTSNQAFTQGLFIADIAHMPGTACGIWPAYWMFGPNWPASGEIDIIEGVNRAATNTITLHTAPGCSVSGSGSLPSSRLLTSNCNEGNAGTGCSFATANTQGYGDGFNAVGGGVYAMQWAGDGIFVWFWPRGSIPSDVSNGAPDTTRWGAPTASFSGSGCNFPASFSNHNIVFDTTFCGDWAGSAWGSSGCGSAASSCKAYVDGNPGAFSQGYWLINSVKVYQ